MYDGEHDLEVWRVGLPIGIQDYRETLDSLSVLASVEYTTSYLCTCTTQQYLGIVMQFVVGRPITT